MSESLSVGQFTVTELKDGVSHLPPMFYPGADFEAHPEMLSSDGTYHIRGGAYLVQGDGVTMLVDAGNGPDSLPFPPDLAAAAGLTAPPEFIATSGLLPESLKATGVAPEDVTIIVLTHLHIDHIGWVAPKGTLFFPNAEVYFGAADWQALIEPADSDDTSRLVMETAKAAGVLRPMDAPEVDIAPGITAVHAPGHTPGSYIVSLISDGSTAFLTGDVIQHPDQLTQKNVHFLTDMDQERATETRSKIFAAASSSAAAIATSHVPNPTYRRIAEGTRWVDAAGS